MAVATLITAAVLTSAIGAIINVGSGAAAAAGGAQAMAQNATPINTASRSQGETSMYTMDSLFRLPADAAKPAGSPPPTPTSTQARTDAPDRDGDAKGSKDEATRIFANSIQTGPLSVEDRRYAGQLVKQRTGLTQEEAEARVAAAYDAAQRQLHDTQVKAKQVADQARKDAAYASLWVFVSLLMGAFFASLMATIGGRRRDLS